MTDLFLFCIRTAHLYPSNPIPAVAASQHSDESDVMNACNKSLFGALYLVSTLLLLSSCFLFFSVSSFLVLPMSLWCISSHFGLTFFLILMLISSHLWHSSHLDASHGPISSHLCLLVHLDISRLFGLILCFLPGLVSSGLISFSFFSFYLTLMLVYFSNLVFVSSFSIDSSGLNASLLISSVFRLSHCLVFLLVWSHHVICLIVLPGLVSSYVFLSRLIRSHLYSYVVMTLLILCYFV